MACWYPVKCYVKSKASRVRRPLVVGCGHCTGCRADQARQWSVRIMHERQQHDSAWFLTLTYADDRLPLNGSLSPNDFRRFFKTLRRDYPPGAVRYYGVGEYGSRTQRPHYHAVLYGPRFLDRGVTRTDDGIDVWWSPTLETYWPHGLHEFGTVTNASANYVAGYVRKKLEKQDPEGHAYLRVDPDSGELHQVEPEFSRMSLRPAIGRRWIEKYWRDVYPRDQVVVNGRTWKPPRFYDRVMDDPHSKCEDLAFERSYPERQRAMLKVREQRIEQAVEKTAYELRAGEKHQAARQSLFSNRGKV